MLGEPLALAVTDPLSAVVFASKLPPIVIGQITRTSPCSDAPRVPRHDRCSGEGSPISVDFMKDPQLPFEQIAQTTRWCDADEARRIRRVSSAWLTRSDFNSRVGAVDAAGTMVPTIDG